MMGNDIIERFKNEAPYGWIISANQRSPNTSARLIKALLEHGLEVYTANQAFTHDGVSYPKGSYIIPTSQAYGLYVKNLLEIQNAPDLRKYPHIWQGLVGPFPYTGPPFREYDGVGWTLPVQMGISSNVMSKPLEVAKTQITEPVLPSGAISGGGSQYVFSHAENFSFRAVNRILKQGGRVSWALADFGLGGTSYPKGTFIVDGGSIGAGALRDIAAKTNISMKGGSVKVSSKSLQKPRIGLYKSWDPSMDEAWTVWMFEEYEFPFQELTDAEIKAGNLRERYDALILPDQSAKSIIEGPSSERNPIHPDYAGGITKAGLENIKKFVESGGILICNQSSSDLAVEAFNIPVKNVLKDVKTTDFFCPGSLLKIACDTTHPLAYGMEENDVAIFGNSSRVYETPPPAEQEAKKEEKPSLKIVVRFPTEPLLVSGKISGEEKIQGKAAVLDVSVGKGKAVLFGINVQNRAQTHTTFKLLFNAIFNR